MLELMKETLANLYQYLANDLCKLTLLSECKENLPLHKTFTVASVDDNI